MLLVLPALLETIFILFFQKGVLMLTEYLIGIASNLTIRCVEWALNRFLKRS